MKKHMAQFFYWVLPLEEDLNCIKKNTHLISAKNVWIFCVSLPRFFLNSHLQILHMMPLISSRGWPENKAFSTLSKVNHVVRKTEEVKLCMGSKRLFKCHISINVQVAIFSSLGPNLYTQYVFPELSQSAFTGYSEFQLFYPFLWQKRDFGGQN